MDVVELFKINKVNGKISKIGRNRIKFYIFHISILTLKAAIATKVVCFSCLLKCLRSLYGKQYILRSQGQD